MSTSARGQSGLPGWLGLLAWLAVGLFNVSGAQAAETVWVDDATPAGASLSSDGGDQWTWITSNPAPYSGTQAHQSVAIAGEHQHYFMGTPASGQLGINVGDKLFAYVYLDPANPPSEIMLQWNDNNNSWEHRAYWGANNITWGTDGTVSRVYMGALPAARQWVRLEVPASQVGLEGATLNGMAFTLFDGSATWDRAGKASSSTIAPSVSLTAPAANQTYTAPAGITLSATAAESGGTISRVDFYSGASLLGAATAAPYTYTWSNVPAGSYTFTAVATDTRNVSTTSSPVSVSVGAAVVTQIYYIYTDQLNTPRLITDTTNTAVWRNDQADPFNASAPYDDPGNTGHHFVFNLRFPGQYYDQETGLAYNYYRDYDATTGRYVQSDPIGLMGGMNTYSYVGGDPVNKEDPLGLFMIYARDARIYGTRYTVTFTGPVVQAGNELGDFLLGRLGKIGKIAKELDKKTKFGAGMCDIKGGVNKVNAAKYDPKLQDLYESFGYQPGAISGTDLTVEQLKGFLEKAYSSYPGLQDYYPSINDLINTANNRMPKLPF